MRAWTREASLMEPSIREYRAEDRESVVELSLRAWAPVLASMRNVLGPAIDVRLHGEDWRVHQARNVEAVLDETDMHVWVAEHGASVVAFMAVKLDAGRSMGELYMLAVDPDFQNRGLGAHMTGLATDWMRAAGMRVAMISTGGDDGHAPARRTYEKAGYTQLPVANYFLAL
jgi:ribosomal protein S18 acetylase RimI-like enzyme